MKKQCISKGWKFREDNNDYVCVDLPHDYAISSKRSKDAPGGSSNGFFNSGIGHYKKFIDFPIREHTILDIDGAYMCAEISVNDNLIALHPHGYTPYLADITDSIVWGEKNKISVKVSPHQPSTRWYSGAGIYRDVFIWTGGDVRIEPWDMYITTISANEKKSQVRINSQISSDITASCRIKIKITDKSGNVVFTDNDECQVSGGTKSDYTRDVLLENASLWSIASPSLYNIEINLFVNNELNDTCSETFGIRVFKATATEGLTLNGECIKLRGGCIHHDNGAIGAAAFPAAEERKVKRLKAHGFNALRISHNPPSLALMEICDREGIILMDEAFDMWNMEKTKYDYHMWFDCWWKRDIQSMVKRDRMHPCIMAYSIGNEILERAGRSNGYALAREISNEIRKYDDSRFVTSGICGIWGFGEADDPDEYSKINLNGFDSTDELYWEKVTEKYMEPLDIVGYNYLYENYEKDHTLYPNRIIWGSETHALNFYHSWKAVIDNSYVIGDFTWTAYDNLGEAGTGRYIWEKDGFITGISQADYPWRSCFQGDLDLCGYPRPQSYFRQAIWGTSTEPKAFTTHPKHNGEGFSGTGWHWYDVVDTWNFEDEYIGTPVKVNVYTVCDEVRFTLNGKYICTQKPKDGIVTANIPYERGTLVSENTNNGKVVGTSELKTTGEAYKVVITPEKAEICADNRDLGFFEIEIQDSLGNRIPLANNEISCITDGCELVCIFSGDPKNEDQYGSNTCHTFRGKALAVVKTLNAGTISITVGGKNLKSAHSQINATE